MQKPNNINALSLISQIAKLTEGDGQPGFDPVALAALAPAG
jgi:hypothetical protein